MKKLLFLLAIVFNQSAFGQIADGTIAPDFTLTDYDGTEHNLYSYLDAGKTVFVEIFAAHCPTCWNYHQTNTLKNLYNSYGPNGTDELTVLALEYDEYNGHNAFIGDGDPWVTQGNWLESTPYPIFNVEWPDRGVFTDYNVTFYPVIYKICPNKVVERIMTSETTSQLYQKASACQGALSLTEHPEFGNIRFDPTLQSLIIDDYEKVQRLTIMDVSGRTLKTIDQLASSVLILNDLPTGIYLFDVQTNDGRVVKKLFVGAH